MFHFHSLQHRDVFWTCSLLWLVPSLPKMQRMTLPLGYSPFFLSQLIFSLCSTLIPSNFFLQSCCILAFSQMWSFWVSLFHAALFLHPYLSILISAPQSSGNPSKPGIIHRWNQGIIHRWNQGIIRLGKALRSSSPTIKWGFVSHSITWISLHF